MSTCQDIMTKYPTCCLPNDHVSRAAQIMWHENVGAVPVVDSMETKTLVGIVTDRDLALKVVGEERDNQHTRVEAVMTPDPWTCQPDDALQKAVGIMAEQQIRRIPIVDESDRIVGIIAQADIATRVENPQQTASVVEHISQCDKPE